MRTRTARNRTVKVSPDIVLESSWCAGTLALEFEADLPASPHLFPLAIVEMSLAWEVADWAFDASAILDPNEWIDDAYGLKLQMKRSVDLDPCREISLDLTFLWDETTPGRAIAELTYELSDMTSTAIEWEVDCELAQLDRLAPEVRVA